MRIKSLTSLIFLGLLWNYNSQNAPLRVYDLKSEYLVNPIGIDVKTPRLSWKIYDKRRGAVQKAYKISVGTDSTKVAAGNGSHWNTGIINADHQMVMYGGKIFQAFQKYYWSLSVWDKNDKKVQNGSPASFEMGMMETRNWMGSWISDSRDINKKESPYFRKEFNIQKKIKKARVYIAAAGLFELYLNGKKIGDHQLDRFCSKRIQ